MADAGLTRDDIDGLATYPGMGTGTPGFAGPTTPEVQDALRLSLDWHDGGGEGPGQMRALIAACLAVGAGLARHVLVYRTVTESTAQGEGGRQGIGGAGDGTGASRDSRGFLQWTLPFGAVSAVNWLALVADRRVHEFGLTREQLGQIAINGRRNAAAQSGGRIPGPHDPGGLPGGPDDLDPALPLRLRRPVRRLDGFRRLPPGLRPGRPASGLSRQRGGHGAARPAELGPVRRHDHHGRPRRRPPPCGSGPISRPADVDMAQLYDGFSILAMVWLEALGFCGRGESGPFVEDGSAIALDGVLPLNTAGGQLSGGRLHGFGLIHEACVQLRGEGGDRQVPRPGGRTPEVAAVANGGGPIAGSLLLTRGPG